MGSIGGLCACRRLLVNEDFSSRALSRPIAFGSGCGLTSGSVCARSDTRTAGAFDQRSRRQNHPWHHADGCINGEVGSSLGASGTSYGKAWSDTGARHECHKDSATHPFVEHGFVPMLTPLPVAPGYRADQLSRWHRCFRFIHRRRRPIARSPRGSSRRPRCSLIMSLAHSTATLCLVRLTSIVASCRWLSQRGRRQR